MWSHAWGRLGGRHRLRQGMWLCGLQDIRAVQGCLLTGTGWQGASVLLLETLCILSISPGAVHTGTVSMQQGCGTCRAEGAEIYF